MNFGMFPDIPARLERRGVFRSAQQRLASDLVLVLLETVGKTLVRVSNDQQRLATRFFETVDKTLGQS
jgi:hypothetical protein